MQQYHDLLRHIRTHGKLRTDRTGTGTIGVFGYQTRFDLTKGFPLVTTKRIPFKGVVEELLWFLSGSTNEGDLRAKGVTIWQEWATAAKCALFGRKAGDLGPVYGHQWRNAGATEIMARDPEGESIELTPTGLYHKNGFDQISWVINEIRNNPDSRRLIVSGWNPKEATMVALPPCHTMFQFYVQDGVLSCQLYQRKQYCALAA